MDFFLVPIIHLCFLFLLDHCGTGSDLSTSPLPSKLAECHKVTLCQGPVGGSQLVSQLGEDNRTQMDLGLTEENSPCLFHSDEMILRHCVGQIKYIPAKLAKRPCVVTSQSICTILFSQQPSKDSIIPMLLMRKQVQREEDRVGFGVGETFCSNSHSCQLSDV